MRLDVNKLKPEYLDPLPNADLVPALREQRRIVEILDSQDDQIRLTEMVIAKLEHTRAGSSP